MVYKIQRQYFLTITSVSKSVDFDFTQLTQKEIVLLVISRIAGESIKIGSDITVIILETSNGRMRLGIVAPDEVLILRSDLFQDHEGDVRGGTDDLTYIMD